MRPLRWLLAALLCLGVARADPAPAEAPLPPWAADLLWERVARLAADEARTGLDPMVAAVAETEHLPLPTARRVVTMARAVFHSRPGVAAACTTEAALEPCKARLRALLPDAERLYFESGRSALTLFALYHAHLGLAYTGNGSDHSAAEALPETFGAFLAALDPAEVAPMVNLLVRESFWPLRRHIGPLLARFSPAAPLPLGTRLLVALTATENGQDPGPDLLALWRAMPATGVSDEVRWAVGAELLAASARWNGTAEAFLAIAADLPPRMRAALEAAPRPGGRFTFDGVEFEAAPLDLRPALAIERALAGDARAARRLIALPAPRPEGVFVNVPAGEDAAGLVRARFGPDGMGPWERAVAHTRLYNRTCRSLTCRLKREVVARTGFLPPSSAPVPARGAAAPGPPDALTAALAERLSAPALTVFREVDAPAPAADATLTAATGLTLPPGFRGVFAEVHGERRAVVATSQGLDPSGEVTFGGAWWLESADAGLHWSPPLYLGLRDVRPYVLGPHDATPRPAPVRIDADGESIVLPARALPLDEASIRLPPVNLRFGPERAGLWLRARREDVERDTDADGLTDLVEDRLGTDPRAADTDADGLRDGVDPSPLVKRGRPRGFVDAAFVEALRWLEDDRGEAVVPGAGSDVRGVVVDIAAAAGAYFVLGDRDAWRGVSPPGRRVIVLTRDELAAMDRRFGRTFAVTLETVLLDPRGQRALVTVDQGWKWSTLELRRVRGRWTVKVQRSLITGTPDGFKSPRKALG